MQGLWGPSHVLEASEDFYKALTSMEDLLGKGYRNIAVARLKEQSCKNAALTTNGSIAGKIKFVLSRSLLSAAIYVTLVAIVKMVNTE